MRTHNTSSDNSFFKKIIGSFLEFFGFQPKIASDTNNSDFHSPQITRIGNIYQNTNQVGERKQTEIQRNNIDTEI